MKVLVVLAFGIGPGNSKACVYNVHMKQAGKTSNEKRILENLPLGIEMNLSLCFKVQKSSEICL
jgi:hypothetical protein